MTLVIAELVFAEDRWERRHGFVIQGGIILATGAPADLQERFPEHEREDWGDVAVVPGTVNAHAHSFQSLLRGYGDDLSFMGWRDRVLYPFSERLDRDGIKTGALFDFAEMVRHGVTTVVDFFYLHDKGNENDLAVVEAAHEAGLRLVLGRSMYDWSGAPTRYQETPGQALRNGRALADALRSDRRAFVQPAPHSIHGASPEMIRAGAALAEELDTPFHIHVAEGRYERELSLERHGLSPVKFLDSLGVLNERAILVHCVWVDPEDLDLIAERGSRIVHNPGANSFLGDGIAPLREMLARDIPVALGTDGGCTNSRQSVFEEMRMAALLAKAIDANGEALTAEDVLIAGTRRGGEVLGLPVGRIAPDHAADLVVLDLSSLSLLPAATAPKQVVYAMQPEAIARVYVAGEVVAERGVPTGIDPAELRVKVAEVTKGWEPPAG
jgi:5-methylthioadenosine/S-adenosylhomocysteine deaminase